MKKLFAGILLLAFVLCGCADFDPDRNTSPDPSGNEGAGCAYPLLLVDTTNSKNEAYALCAFASQKLRTLDTYAYNGQAITAFLRQSSVPVTTPLIDLEKTLAFFDATGKKFEATASAVSCTGRIIDEVVEVRVRLDGESPAAQKFYLGSYSGIDLIPEGAVYNEQSIAVDLDGDGTADSVSWTFTPTREDYLDYAVKAVRNNVEYTVVEKGYLPLQKDDLAVFAADVDLDGEVEIVVYAKGASRFGQVTVYRFENEGYAVLHDYTVDPEP